MFRNHKHLKSVSFQWYFSVNKFTNFLSSLWLFGKNYVSRKYSKNILQHFFSGVSIVDFEQVNVGRATFGINGIRNFPSP